MDWEITHDPDQGVLVAKAAGPATIGEALQFVADLAAACEAGRPSGVLVRADADVFHLRLAETQMVASAWRRSAIPDDLPIALVTSDPVTFGVLRMVIAFRESDHTRVFRNEGDARRWLGT